MSLFDMMSVSASALAAERQRAEVTAANLANAETTRTDGGGPYVRKEVVFRTNSNVAFQTLVNRHGGLSPREDGAVRVAAVVEDSEPPVRRFEPGNPDADSQGYVSYPAINPVTEMVDLMGAARAYQLNASAVSAAKQMIQESIDILKTS